MKALVFSFLLISGSVFADVPLAIQANRISTNIAAIESHLGFTDRLRIEASLNSIEQILSSYGPVQHNPFKFTIEDDSLIVFDRGTGNKLLTWNKHDQMKVLGNILALNDKDGEFRAIINIDGVAQNLVSKWVNTKDFAVHADYIGLTDTKGITDIYSTRTPNTKLVNNWKGTVKHFFGPRFIVLLDNESKRNLEVFDVSGKEIIKMTGVTFFKIRGECILEYEKNGQMLQIHVDDYL